MNSTPEHQRQNLLATLIAHDNESRDARVARVEWLVLQEPCRSGAYVGRSETMALLGEAKAVFLEGHFIATLLVAMAYIEHTVNDELQHFSKQRRSPNFSVALGLAAEHKLFPEDWLIRAKRLSLRRNPFAHLKDQDHEHGLGYRVQLERNHPLTILEADAKDAISLMYQFFVATSRELNFEGNETTSLPRQNSAAVVSPETGEK